jgi:O-antigen ligase
VAAVAIGLLLARLPLVWGLGLVVVTAVSILIIIQPIFGFAIALLLAPFGAYESVVFGPSLFDSGQLVLLLTLAVWLGRGLSRKRIFIPHTFLNMPLAIFLFITAVSLIGASSLTFGIKELLKWIEIAAIMLIIVAEKDEGRRMKDENSRLHVFTPSRITHHAPRITSTRLHVYTLLILAMLLAAGTVQAFLGIWQFGLHGDGPEHFLVLGQFYRAYGTFEQPNPFAGYMNLTALLSIGVVLGLLALLWRQWRENGRSQWHTVVALLLIGLCAGAASLAVIFSWSRGAWLSFAAGTAVLVLFWPRKLWHGVLLIAVGGVLFFGGVQAGVVPASITERITSFSEDLRFGDVRGEDINDANYAVLERLAHWQAALDMARDNVWLGVGFGNYEPAYAQYALLNWPYPLGHAHNYYLNLLAEVGVLGLAAYVLLWTAVFIQTIRLLQKLDWPWRGIALGLLAVWVSLTVHHLVDKLYVNNIYIHLGVMLGLLGLLQEIGRSEIGGLRPRDSVE